MVMVNDPQVMDQIASVAEAVKASVNVDSTTFDETFDHLQHLGTLLQNSTLDQVIIDPESVAQVAGCLVVGPLSLSLSD